MPPPDGEIQRRLREYAAPTWGYRRGKGGEVEKDLFDGELPQGWTDSPANVKATGIVAAVVASDGALYTMSGDGTVERAEPERAREDEGGDPHGYRDKSWPELRAELKALTGKGPKPGTTREEVIAQLQILGPGDAE